VVGNSAPSPEHLNAFVDGELAKEERATLVALLATNGALREAVCAIYRLHDLVTVAYKRVPARPPRRGRSRRRE